MAVIEKTLLPEKVIDEIRNRLNSGRLTIGEKLPNQNELSHELGVSRTSLREAMKILDLLGVIEQRPGYGTVIRKDIPVLRHESPHMSLLTDSEATFELLEAREVIECGAVKLAALKATDAQIQDLLELVDRMDRLLAQKNYEGFKKLDCRYHELINTASGNRFLNDSAFAILQHMHQFIRENIELMPGLLKESQQYHRAISQSIAARDAEQAERDMRRHIQTITTSYRRCQSTAVKKATGPEGS